VRFPVDNQPSLGETEDTTIADLCGNPMRSNQNWFSLRNERVAKIQPPTAELKINFWATALSMPVPVGLQTNKGTKGTSTSNFIFPCLPPCPLPSALSPEGPQIPLSLHPWGKPQLGQPRGFVSPSLSSGTGWLDPPVHELSCQ